MMAAVIAPPARLAVGGVAGGRWTYRRKADVCRAIIARAISRADACERYGLTDDELSDWLAVYRVHRDGGLKRMRRRLKGRAQPIPRTSTALFLGYLKGLAR